MNEIITYSNFWGKEDKIDREIKEIIEKSKYNEKINGKNICKSCGGF